MDRTLVAAGATVVVGSLIALQAPNQLRVGKGHRDDARRRDLLPGGHGVVARHRVGERRDLATCTKAADVKWYYLIGGLLGRGLRDNGAAHRAHAGRRAA